MAIDIDERKIYRKTYRGVFNYVLFSFAIRRSRSFSILSFMVNEALRKAILYRGPYGGLSISAEEYKTIPPLNLFTVRVVFCVFSRLSGLDAKWR